MLLEHKCGRGIPDRTWKGFSLLLLRLAPCSFTRIARRVKKEASTAARTRLVEILPFALHEHAQRTHVVANKTSSRNSSLPTGRETHSSREVDSLRSKRCGRPQPEIERGGRVGFRRGEGRRRKREASARGRFMRRRRPPSWRRRWPSGCPERRNGRYGGTSGRPVRARSPVFRRSAVGRFTDRQRAVTGLEPRHARTPRIEG